MNLKNRLKEMRDSRILSSLNTYNPEDSLYKALLEYIEDAERCCLDCEQNALEPRIQVAFIHGWNKAMKYREAK